jgi:CDP-diacylglycerol---serine O-phosphatidyltransferase
VAILVALIFDMLDGSSARWTKTTSQFGIEYDSLADLVSFGIAPGVLIYSWALGGYGFLGQAVVFAFVGCGALRLARYNVLTGTSDNRYFLGLPIPAAAGVLASLMLLDHHILRLGREVVPIVILGVTFVLAFLMVSTIKYTKFKGMRLLAGEGFMYLVWAVLVIMLVAAAPQIALFMLFAGYALSGVFVLLLGLLRRALRSGPATERAPGELKD